MRYLFLNALFHFFHIVLIGFVTFGWLFPSLRAAHLALIFLTLGSWFFLGRWLGFGFGYCPITDWHWKIKEALGEGRPQGSYIYVVLQKITGRHLNAGTVDKFVLVGTMAVTGLSLIVNVNAWMS